MPTVRPYVMSIAGFDPSGGAGLLADIKTFEQNNAYGFGICSALTFQNDIDFVDVKWIEPQVILTQINVIRKRFNINWIKIGLIENLDVLEIIISNILSFNPDAKIVWDPIMKASAGFIFHETFSKKQLLNILKKIYLLTPNLDEAEKIFSEIKSDKLSQFILTNEVCSILVKGGHSKADPDDVLYTKDDKTVFNGKRFENIKHGSGCVLSSAITANLANGLDLKKACEKAKKYVNEFLMSNNTSLGHHVK